MAGPIYPGLLAAKDQPRGNGLLGGLSLASVGPDGVQPSPLLHGLLSMSPMGQIQSLSPYGQDGWQVPPAVEDLQGLLSSAKSGATYPGDLYAGKAQPGDLGRTLDLAGLLTLGSGAAPATANELRMGIKAYHGSPHDFDKFSMDKIGTGEGAQAYGHGLYFAENEGVAKSYRDALAGMTDKEISEFYKPGTVIPTDVGREKVLDFKPGKDGSPFMVKTVKVDEHGDPLRTAAPRWHGTAPSTQQYEQVTGKRPGSMYEVDINANPEDFIDWDKALKDQPPKVRDALNRVGRDTAPHGLDKLTDDMRGIDIKSLLQDPKGAERLKEHGVAGIKYLDNGSRGSGAGTRNYVAFDDKTISIIKKYGIAGAAAMGAITIEQARQMQSDKTFNNAYLKGNAT